MLRSAEALLAWPVVFAPPITKQEHTTIALLPTPLSQNVYRIALKTLLLVCFAGFATATKTHARIMIFGVLHG
jgi:hypothetical protein